ncbi:MAG: nuclear transport factor 2 family protein [Pseudomonadota bacterium]
MDIEQRLSRLEAIEAIKQLKSRYFQACDRKRPEQVLDCFAAGEIDIRFGRIGNFHSREQLVSVFSELACHPHIVEMHHGQNPQIHVHDGERASGQWGLYYFMIDTERQLVTQLAGEYQDGFVHREGRWWINRSHYEVTSTTILELSEGFARALFAGRSAPETLDDPARQSPE